MVDPGYSHCRKSHALASVATEVVGNDKVSSRSLFAEQRRWLEAPVAEIVLGQLPWQTPALHFGIVFKVVAKIVIRIIVLPVGILDAGDKTLNQQFDEVRHRFRHSFKFDSMVPKL